MKQNYLAVIGLNAVVCMQGHMSTEHEAKSMQYPNVIV